VTLVPSVSVIFSVSQSGTRVLLDLLAISTGVLRTVLYSNWATLKLKPLLRSVLVYHKGVKRVLPDPLEVAKRPKLHGFPVQRPTWAQWPIGCGHHGRKFVLRRRRTCVMSGAGETLLLIYCSVLYGNVRNAQILMVTAECCVLYSKVQYSTACGASDDLSQFSKAGACLSVFGGLPRTVTVQYGHYRGSEEESCCASEKRENRENRRARPSLGQTSTE
jgi:hypothetical protein